MRLVDRPPFTALGLLWPFGGPPPRPGPTTSASGAAFRLVTANALHANRRLASWADAILALGPDVLCVEELTTRVAAALRRAGIDDVLPYQCTSIRRRSAGTGLWSRSPLEDTEVIDTGRALVVARVATINTTVAAIHTVAPSSPRRAAKWLASFAGVGALLDRTHGPIVVAGDWNATIAHGPLRSLLAGDRLRDAHTDAGRRFARTWPAHVPVALLDRVLVSDEVAVRSISEHRVPGSDHRAVAADLVVAAE